MARFDEWIPRDSDRIRLDGVEAVAAARAVEERDSEYTPLRVAGGAPSGNWRDPSRVRAECPMECCQTASDWLQRTLTQENVHATIGDDYVCGQPVSYGLGVRVFALVWTCAALVALWIYFVSPVFRPLLSKIHTMQGMIATAEAGGEA